MPVDLRDLMARAADEPASVPDTEAILQRASRLRRRSLATITATVVLIAAGLAVGLRLSAESQAPKIAARPQTREPVGTIRQFPLPSPNRDFSRIARGPDRSLWFTPLPGDETPLGREPRLGRVSIDGTLSLLPIPSEASGITTGKDGNVYFGQPGALARLSPSTTRLSSFPLPEPGATPMNLTTAPDGDIWLTQLNSAHQVWRFSPHSATFQPVALPDPVSRPEFLTSDTKGNIWIADVGGRIVRIDREGAISVFPVRGGPADRVGFGITAGPDGNIWFTGFHDVISRMTPTGHITEYSVPSAVAHVGQPLIVGITTGADGDLWFTNLAAQTIGRMTPKGKITEYPIKPPGAVPAFLAAGADGNIWFTTHSTIGRITTGAAPSGKN